MLFFVTWTDPADDTVMEEATKKLGKMAEDEARRRELLVDFLYLNYANREQKVFERSLTAENLEKMHKIETSTTQIRRY